VYLVNTFYKTNLDSVFVSALDEEWIHLVLILTAACLYYAVGQTVTNIESALEIAKVY